MSEACPSATSVGIESILGGWLSFTRDRDLPRVLKVGVRSWIAAQGRCGDDSTNLENRGSGRDRSCGEACQLWASALRSILTTATGATYGLIEGVLDVMPRGSCHLSCKIFLKALLRRLRGISSRPYHLSGVYIKSPLPNTQLKYY